MPQQEKGGAAMGWPNRMALQEKLALTDAAAGGDGTQNVAGAKRRKAY